MLISLETKKGIVLQHFVTILHQFGILSDYLAEKTRFFKLFEKIFVL
jgi:hypothetical protein